MAICLKCNREVFNTADKPRVSICARCTDAIYDALPHEIILAMAKVGVCAVIDEVTGYEKIRPKDDLKRLFDKFKGE